MKKDDILTESIRKCTYICPKCQKRVVIATRDRRLCPQCGNWIYKNKKLEFKYKLNECIKRRK